MKPETEDKLAKFMLLLLMACSVTLAILVVVLVASAVLGGL